MTRIGPCAATQNGDDGRSTRRGPDFAMALVPAEASETDHAPDLLVVAGDRGDLRQVGAGRQRIAGKAGATIAIPIDDPGLVQPLRANLFQADHRPMCCCGRARRLAPRGTGRMRNLVHALALAATLVNAAPGHANTPGRADAPPIEPLDLAAFVREAARTSGLPERWIYAVIRLESAGRIHAVSPAGAMGLMQLMPATWADLRGRLGLGSDPFDPHDNIRAGAAYLRALYDRYGPSGFLAAYNAGPGRYEDWLAGRSALPLETRRYLSRAATLLEISAPRGADGGFDQVRVAGVERPRSGPATPFADIRTSLAAAPWPRLTRPSSPLFVAVATASER